MIRRRTVATNTNTLNINEMAEDVVNDSIAILINEEKNDGYELCRETFVNKCFRKIDNKIISTVRTVARRKTVYLEDIDFTKTVNSNVIDPLLILENRQKIINFATYLEKFDDRAFQQFKIMVCEGIDECEELANMMGMSVPQIYENNRKLKKYFRYFEKYVWEGKKTHKSVGRECKKPTNEIKKWEA
jgi:hypothetical protein